MPVTGDLVKGARGGPEQLALSLKERPLSPVLEREPEDTSQRPVGGE